MIQRPRARSGTRLAEAPPDGRQLAEGCIGQRPGRSHRWGRDPTSVRVDSAMATDYRVDSADSTVIAIAGTPGGLGYWLFGADGGISTLGDDRFEGPTATSTSTSRWSRCP